MYMYEIAKLCRHFALNNLKVHYKSMFVISENSARFLGHLIRERIQRPHARLVRYLQFTLAYITSWHKLRLCSRFATVSVFTGGYRFVQLYMVSYASRRNYWHCHCTQQQTLIRLAFA